MYFDLLLQPVLEFGPVYLGSFSRLPLTLNNTTLVPAELMVDLVSKRALLQKIALALLGVDRCLGGGQARWCSLWTPKPVQTERGFV
jgi:hypothetical protein